MLGVSPLQLHFALDDLPEGLGHLSQIASPQNVELLLPLAPHVKQLTVNSLIRVLIVTAGEPDVVPEPVTPQGDSLAPEPAVVRTSQGEGVGQELASGFGTIQLGVGQLVPRLTVVAGFVRHCQGPLPAGLDPDRDP